MTHITVDSVLPAELYNRLLIDHDATELAASLNLELNYVHPLTKILHIHGVSDCVELHLLHRHFTLEEGEAMLHRSLTIPGPDGNTGITVDIAKAVPCPNLAKLPLSPLMWMASSTGKLIPYEYGILEDGSSHHGKIKDISHETWEAFTQDFFAYVQATSLQDIISLKDKSCITGGEYVIPSLRALFRIPYSVINLQASSRLIETGWTVEHSAAAVEVDGPSPEPTDGHVTKNEEHDMWNCSSSACDREGGAGYV